MPSFDEYVRLDRRRVDVVSRLSCIAPYQGISPEYLAALSKHAQDYRIHCASTQGLRNLFNVRLSRSV